MKCRNPQKNVRRNVLLGINASVLTALLPTRWTKPVIETILLPAHAVTSSVCSPVGLWLIKDTRPGEADSGRSLSLYEDNTGDYDDLTKVAWKLSDDNIQLTFYFSDSTAELQGGLEGGCNAMSGVWDNKNTGFSATWEASRVSKLKRAVRPVKNQFKAFR